jgi:hypothetical protein
MHASSGDCVHETGEVAKREERPDKPNFPTPTHYSLWDSVAQRGIMWWSKSKKPPEDSTERLERLEKTVRMLEIEWTDTYDKFRQLHMRVAKRVQRLEEAPETETTQREESEITAIESGGVSLSERQRKLQEQIMQRRNRSGLLHG